jgi:hypothetical protein
MTNVNLNAAVERLIADRRFLARFRRNPERALEGFDLSALEVDALKRGESDELLALGLDPRHVSPEAVDVIPLQSWTVRNAGRLVPTALLAAALLAVAGPAGGTDRAASRRRAVKRRTTVRRRAARAIPRERAARPAIRTQRVALARHGARALRRA